MSFKKQRVYIIPTRYGVMYAIGILVTLLCAAIYGNNLVYMLSFFLLALFLIGMVQTHNNMKGLTIDKLQMQMGVENGRSSGILWLRGSAHGEHVQLIIRMPEIDKNYQFIVDSVAAGTLTPCQFYFPTKSRGKHSVTQAKISSVFPFGMFFAWQTINTEAQYCIYPAPLGHSEFPLSVIRGDSQTAEKGLTGDDFSQHRSYQEGESQRHIDWKAYARGRPLLVKEFKDGQRDSYFFQWEDTQGVVDDRLRQISKWIHLCEEKKQPYGMHLGTVRITPGLGWGHRCKCLELLAKYEGKNA